MYKLTRQIRFSINPFLTEQSLGFNSYASKPAGEGLSIFFELSVELAGEVEPTTGFVVNVVDIDKNVLKFVVPIFTERICSDFRHGKHIRLFEIAGLLRASWCQLADKFTSASLNQLSLKLNPFRKVTINSEECDMIYFSEKFEFAATHKLWNDDFSNKRNFEVFGKCANPAGHGHNYVLEVTVEKTAGEDNLSIGDFEKIVDNEFIRLVDHKNLNTEIARFSQTNPTVENIAAFAWERIAGKFGLAQLHCVTVWETDKTYCSYYG